MAKSNKKEKDTRPQSGAYHLINHKYDELQKAADQHEKKKGKKK